MIPASKAKIYDPKSPDILHDTSKVVECRNRNRSVWDLVMLCMSKDLLKGTVQQAQDARAAFRLARSLNHK